MNLKTIADDLRATGLEWAEKAADYLDECTAEYAVQVLRGGEWRYAEADPFSNAVYTYRYPEDAPWIDNTHGLQCLKETISRRRPDLETRIVRRTVSPVEVVE